ncbi:MAG: cell surface protein SprA [Gemmatimonadota bacterium]|nr:MAG: cell surface protein SprA [Gemmatimonadota bacterium]
MRLKLAIFGGAAVILAPGWSPWQAGASDFSATASPSAQDTAAQDTAAAPPGPPRLAIGLKDTPLPFAIDLTSRLPDPVRQRPELWLRSRNRGELWAAELGRRAQGWTAVLWLARRPLVAPAPPAGPVEDLEVRAAEEEAELEGEPAVAAPAERATAQPEEEPPIPDVLGQYADLGFTVDGRVEIGGGWNRFRPCDVTLQVDCSPSLIPTLKPDIQFGARVGGTVSQRVHVSVDYDNRREFDAANNINLYYQGLGDEIIQRVEVGDVSFPLPHSRYLTRGIPAGNFGFRAAGQMGPVDFQAVWAQQKGDLGSRELQVGGTGQGFEQRATTILDDADYERGRFFFLFNPTRLFDYPHVDIQRLLASDAPSDVRPASVVKVYRYEVLGVDVGAQIPEGFITAIAVATDTLQTDLGADTVVVDTLTGLFRPLVEGEDYVLHQSGLWLQLRNTLSVQEGLALTYISADGEEIGTFGAEAASDAHNADPENIPPPTLELIKGVNQRPGTATWRREMHHVYRVSVSPGVVLTSVELIISQGDPEVGNTFRSTPSGTQLEFLKIFGLDDSPTDNLLDASRIYDAGEFGVDGTTSGPTGTYIVLPTLEPFQLPPPLRDVSDPLNGEPFPLEPGDQNTAIYEEPNDQARLGSNLYLLTIGYRQRFEGFLSTISLGLGGVREGSERVTIAERELVRGEDYIIDYDIGQIELRTPERWFQDNPDARVRVTFEQKPLFQLAPTSVFGLQARYGLGRVGDINFIGLSQSEKTLQTRPELGLEPGAVRLGGVSARLNFRPDWLTDFANAIPGVDSDAPSSISLDGELAVSLPSTNTQGVTYVEDFEGGTGFHVPLLSRGWRLGAAPSTNEGAETVAPLFFDETNAAELVWQDQYNVLTAEGEVVFGGLFPGQIDDELRIQGQTRPEPVLTMSLRMPENRRLAPNPSPASGPAWASVTNVIAANGQNFTTIEFLEFYVAVSDERADSTDLVIDLGTVSEDAFAIDSLGVPSGISQLNREVNPPQVWSSADDIGLWGTGCEAELGSRIYRLGEVAANCTRNNGLEDSEDLNQNSVLDDEERFFRYTVEIGDPTSPYFVREANEVDGARFRLFRVPLRRPDHRERVSDADFQNVRHLRLTAISESDNRLMLARVRFLGSRWLKRGDSGVVEGLTDTTTVDVVGTPVEVGPISTLDARYEPPPGVTDEVANQGDEFGLGGVTINEQSLSIRFTDLGAGQRAETYLQYAQTARDFLAYRGLRVWALGIDGPWGTDGAPLRFFVRLGEDKGNYYLYQAELAEVPPGAEGPQLRQAWLPEIRIDFERFIALRARAEDIMLRRGGLPGDSVLQVWDVDVFADGDSTYAIVINQRSRAPNLAAIRQISLGAHNASLDPAVSGEVWVDDLRLDLPVDNTGVVGRIDMDVRASDVLGLNFSYSNENPYFRQLAQDPSFRSASAYRVGGRLEFGQVLPESWAVNMPFNVSYVTAGTKPVLLPRTDIAAERLAGLRAPESRNLRMDLTLNKRPSTTSPAVGWLIDNSSVRLTYDKGSGRTSRSETESSGFAASYGFRDNVGEISIPFFPGPLEHVVFFLPESVRRSRLRLTPTSFQLGTTYVDREARTRRFEEIVELPEDSSVVPIITLDERLQTNTTLNLEPITDLTGRFFFMQGRDLVPTDEVVRGEAAQELIDTERSGVLGVDLGWVVARTVDVNWTYRPVLAPWLTPQLSFDTRFDLNTGASFVDEQQGDTVLTRDFSGSRSVRISAGFNTPVFLRALIGQDSSGVVGAFLGLMDRVDLFSITWVTGLGSSFRRRAASPSLAYQLGFGGFDDFQIQRGDTASRVSDTEALTLSTGFRLPLGAGLNVDYTTNDLFSWSPRTQTRTRRTTWPSLTVSWNRLPIPRFLRGWVAALGLRAGYTVREISSVILDADQDRGSEVTTIPFNLDLVLTTQWSLNYSLTLTDEKRIDPTGVTFRDQTGHTLQVTGQLRALTTTGQFRNPLRVSLRFSHNDQDQCRRLGAAFVVLPPDPDPGSAVPSCEPFTDLLIRDVGLTVNTDVPPFVVGLQAFWRDTQSQIGQRPGSTQLEISLFGQFLFETGEIR